MSLWRHSVAVLVSIALLGGLTGCSSPRVELSGDAMVGTWRIDVADSMDYAIGKWGGAEGEITLHADQTFDMVGVPGAIFSVFEMAEDVTERSGEWAITGEGSSAVLTLSTSYASDGVTRHASPRFRVKGDDLVMLFDVTEDLPDALAFVRN